MHDALQLVTVEPETLTLGATVDDEFLLLPKTHRSKRQLAAGAADLPVISFHFVEWVVFDVHPDAPVEAVEFSLIEPYPSTVPADVQGLEAVLLF